MQTWKIPVSVLWTAAMAAASPLSADNIALLLEIDHFLQEKCETGEWVQNLAEELRFRYKIFSYLTVVQRSELLRLSPLKEECLVKIYDKARPEIEKEPFPRSEDTGEPPVPPVSSRDYGHSMSAEWGDGERLPKPAPSKQTAKWGGRLPKPAPSEKTEPIKNLFPWPPPTPSTRRSFSPDIIPASTAAKTFGEVASRLEEKVRQAEFDAFGYYRAPGGFALVTRIECLDGATGLPLKGQARWGGTTTYFAGFNFSSIFATWRPKGVYRTFVFLLTDDPPMTKPMSSAEVFATAQLWAMEGAPSLPPQIKSLPIGPHHVLIVMVYEFEKVEGGETKHPIPSHWPLDHHLSSLSFSPKP